MRAASLPAGHPRRSPHAREQRQKRPSRGVAARRRRAARERAGEGSAFRVSLSRDSAVRGTMTLRHGFYATWTGALARAARAARSEGEISNARCGVHSGIRFQRFRVFIVHCGARARALVLRCTLYRLFARPGSRASEGVTRRRGRSHVESAAASAAARLNEAKAARRGAPARQPSMARDAPALSRATTLLSNGAAYHLERSASWDSPIGKAMLHIATLLLLQPTFTIGASYRTQKINRAASGAGCCLHALVRSVQESRCSHCPAGGR